MTQQRSNKKKSIEYHFVDINDPDRYKKLKVARACDFCRKRKSKCDVGIPGSGICSNCKKSNNECIFTPVSANSSSNKAIISRQQKKSFTRPPYTPASSSDSSNHSSGNSVITTDTSISPSPSKTHYTPYSQQKNMYQIQNSIFSVDSRGFCGYENYTSSIYNHMLFTSSMVDQPQYSPQFEKELCQVYFEYVHPFFPILDRFHITQNYRTIPKSMKLTIMAIALYFTDHQDAQSMAVTMYHHATLQLDHTPNLLNTQTLFLLYKFQEIITPVGLPLSVVAVNYLKEIRSMLLQQQDTNPVTEEYLCRAGWLLYIIVSLSSPSDEQWKPLLDSCRHPNRFPALTEHEQYDKSELNITCNLIHLINVTLLFSKAVSIMARQETLFNCVDHPEFDKIATSLHSWKSALPSHIALSLSADPPNMYSAQNQNLNGHDGSKSSSFISYLGLLYDVLELLIDLHKPNMHTISKKATRISYRAHCFTMGDMLDTGFLRRAAIQGSRIVCYSLALATQAQSYSLEQKQDTASFDDIKRFYSVCSMSFQILEDIPLSSQLYMTVQTLRNQLKAREQLSSMESQQQQQGFSRSNPSSNYSTPTTEDPSSSNEDSGHYFYTQDHQRHETHMAPPEDRQWQYYHQQHHYDTGFDYQHTMTPDFDQEIITPELETLPMNVESYFDHVPERYPVMVNRSDPCVSVAFQQGSFNFSVNIGISKSCKHHTLL